MSATTVTIGKATTCRSCGAGIEWAKSSKTGKLVPLDLEIATDGNILLDGDAAIVLTKKQLADLGPTSVLRKSHFATCPQAAQWRNRGE